MADRTNVLNQLVDAITASGKSFTSVEKSSIMTFFERQKVPRSEWNKLYSDLESLYTKKSTKSNETTDRKSLATTVDYSDNSHNDVKVRTPRKSVFTEIKKIGG